MLSCISDRQPQPLSVPKAAIQTNVATPIITPTSEDTSCKEDKKEQERTQLSFNSQNESEQSSSCVTPPSNIEQVKACLSLQLKVLL